MDRDTFESSFLHADCMDVMRRYPDGFFDLAIVDPPYGIAITDRHKAKDGESPLVGGAKPFGGVGKSRELTSPQVSAVCGSFGKGRPPIAQGGV